PDPGRDTAAPAAARLRQLRAADYHGLSAAAVPRRDAAALGRDQAAPLRPADRRVGRGEPVSTAVRPAVPFQRLAARPGPQDQEGPPAGVAPQGRKSPGRLKTTIIFIKLLSLVTLPA